MYLKSVDVSSQNVRNTKLSKEPENVKGVTEIVSMHMRKESVTDSKITALNLAVSYCTRMRS